MNEAIAHVGDFHNYITARKLATQMRRIIKKEGIPIVIETRKMPGYWEVKARAMNVEMSPFDLQKTVINILSIILKRI